MVKSSNEDFTDIGLSSPHPLHKPLQSRCTSEYPNLMGEGLSIFGILDKKD